MYVSKLYTEPDAERIREVIRTYSFATVISREGHKPVATHLPLNYHRHDSGEEWLYGHFAKANPQWKAFKKDQLVLAIFQGPHSYISPSWYDHMNVPTWNYVAVHAYGTLFFVSDYEEIRKMFETLITTHEKPQGNRYSIHSMTKEYYDKELKGIQAFKIRIDSVEANFKLSQNRHDRDYRNIEDQLNRLDTDDSRGVAEFMKHKRPRPE